jgi:methyl-accepting chemotaxis protein
MKWKNFKIGKKLGIGFGIVIFLMAALGIVSIFNMATVSTNSKYLADEYLPELEIANNIERFSALTMYEIRGYGLTEEIAFLNQGKVHLAKIKENVKSAEELQKKSTQLVNLKNAVEEISNS